MIAIACLHDRKLAIYHFPSSRESPEKIHASPSNECYSESPPRKSRSHATNKQLGADLDEYHELSSHRSDPDLEVWDATGKTPEEVAA